MSKIIYFLILFSFSTSVNLFGKKEDKVKLTNGSVIIGEIKELRLGKLQYSTDEMSTVYIEWKKIVALESKNHFQLERQDGIRFFGSLGTDTTTGKLLVILDSTAVPLDFIQVVRINRIKIGFWPRLNASLSLGFSYTKASEVAQLNFSGNADYRTRKNSTDLKFSSIFTAQKSKENTQQGDVTVTQMRYLVKKWFLAGNVSLQTNSELGIDLRLLIGAGPGFGLVRSNKSDLAVLAGLVINREWSANRSDVKSTLEGYTAAKFKLFRYEKPELDWDTSFILYPSLTPIGRIRTSFDTKLKWEIIRKFFWNLSFTFNSDSEPPQNAAKTDWSIVLSFGVSK
ncbi:MAG: hypothetical protein AMJ61_00100 [Desulfobacterales bacterium SG8_35_2]|nr:MAG: hypothetical protein AMJ61_00100 [Desulfobacterales bacterium SG8_35_2]